MTVAALILACLLLAAVVFVKRQRDKRAKLRSSDDEVQSTANNDVFFVSASAKDNESAAAASSPGTGTWAAPRSVSKSYLDVFAHSNVAQPPEAPVRQSRWSAPGKTQEEGSNDDSHIGQTRLGHNPAFKRNSVASVDSDNESLFDENAAGMFEGGREVGLCICAASGVDRVLVRGLQTRTLHLL